MPKGWSDFTAGILAGSGPERALPLVAAFDPSAYAAVARREFCRMRPDSLAKVVCACDAVEAVDRIEGVLSMGFGASVAPLRLFEREPRWCAGFFSVGEDVGEGWMDWAGRLLERRRSDVRLYLYLRLQDPGSIEDAVEMVGRLSGDVTAFCVCEEGALRRPLDMLGLGSACHLLAGWERFCRLGDLDPHRALGLGRGRVFALGFGSDGIDLGYHRERLGRRIAGEIEALWRLQAAPSPAPEGPDPEEVVRGLLPKKGYFLTGSDDVRTRRLPGVGVGKRVFRVGWGDGPEWRPVVGRTSSEQMKEYLGVIEDTSAFLGFIVMPNTVRFLERRGRQLRERVEQLFATSVSLPGQPRGLFEALRTRIGQMRDQGAEWGRAKTLGGGGEGALDRLTRKARKAIETVPRMEGAFLRLFLISVGLVWLWIGPAIWGGAAWDWAVELRRAEVWGAVTLLCALIVAVPAWHAIRMARATNAIEDAADAMRAGHVADVCRRLIREVHRAGQWFLQECEKKEAQLNDIADGFAGTRKDLGGRLPENRKPVFGDATVDRLFNPRADELGREAFGAFRERLGAEPLDRSLEEWRESLRSESTACADRFLDDLGFGDIASEIAPESQAGQLLLRNVVGDARKPCIEKGVPIVPPLVLCLGPPAWREALGDLTGVEFEALPCRDIVAVGAHSVGREEAT